MQTHGPLFWAVQGGSFLTSHIVFQHVLDLILGMLPARRDCFRQFVEQGIAGGWVFNAQLPELRTQDAQGFELGLAHHARGIHPIPDDRGPTEYVSGMQVSDDDLRAVVGLKSNRHRAAQNDIQVIGPIALFENHRFRRGNESLEAGRYQFQVVLAQVLQDRDVNHGFQYLIASYRPGSGAF